MIGFIEVTKVNAEPVLIAIDSIQYIEDGYIGLNGVGLFCQETYEEIRKKIEEAQVVFEVIKEDKQ